MKRLFVVALVLAASVACHADAISGSFPVVLFSATQNSSNLLLSTTEHATNSLTSGLGSGDFSIIPLMSSFGAFSLDDSTVGSGGGFSASNLLYGTFDATSGTIVHQSNNFLDVRLVGTFTPGPAFAADETSSGAIAHISFTQTGNSLSGSYTLATIPEPSTLGLLGSGLLMGGFGLRRFLV